MSKVKRAVVSQQSAVSGEQWSEKIADRRPLLTAHFFKKIHKGKRILNLTAAIRIEKVTKVQARRPTRWVNPR